MAEGARVLFDQPIRKPPGSEGQYNWITGGVDVVPEQIELPLPPLDDAILPDGGSVILLATENGSQLFVSGFGLFIGKKSGRVVVKQGKSVCAQVPLMRLQEIIITASPSRRGLKQHVAGQRLQDKQKVQQRPHQEGGLKQMVAAGVRRWRRVVQHRPHQEGD